MNSTKLKMILAFLSTISDSVKSVAVAARTVNSSIFVDVYKRQRPLQVELENGRSRLQNDFQSLESMLIGFIAPASNADVYTSAYFALQNTCWELSLIHI